MMKRVIAVLAVVVMMGVSSIAFAASDISVSGEIGIRSRDFQNMTLDKEANNKTGSQVDTQERVRLEVNVKADDVSGKISIENDYDTWGRNEAYQANIASMSTNSATGATSGGPFLRLREAWVGFKIPDTPIGIKAGHQLLALSNGWFYRAMKYGADAWVVYTDIDAIHLGLVDIKASEGNSGVSDDIDAYALVANYKLDDKSTVGFNWTLIKDRAATFATATVTSFARANLGYGTGISPFGSIELNNLSLFYAGKIGAIGLKAEFDVQNGKIKAADGFAVDDVKLEGNQIVLQGDMALDPVTINATLARGSGVKESDGDNSKVSQIITLLDTDKHYTLLFEYKIPTAGLNLASGGASDDHLHTGFANVTTLNVGVNSKVGKSLTVGAQAWWLQATEAVELNDGSGDTSKDLGMELDANINWQLTPSLSWNWDLGYFKAGKAYTKTNGDKPDAATGIQGVLSFKF